MVIYSQITSVSVLMLACIQASVYQQPCTADSLSAWYLITSGQSSSALAVLLLISSVSTASDETLFRHPQEYLLPGKTVPVMGRLP